MTSAPIILVPGFWLGAWAWDEVAAALRADGHDVTAVTLPGLESADADRSSVTLADHVDGICDAVTAAGRPAVLAVHSGAGASGYAATDRIPEQIASTWSVSVIEERSVSTDSRPGSVNAVTSCPSALRAAATSSHAHAPSQNPGTRTIGVVLMPPNLRVSHRPDEAVSARR